MAGMLQEALLPATSSSSKLPSLSFLSSLLYEEDDEAPETPQEQLMHTRYIWALVFARHGIRATMARCHAVYCLELAGCDVKEVSTRDGESIIVKIGADVELLQDLAEQHRIVCRLADGSYRPFVKTRQDAAEFRSRVGPCTDRFESCFLIRGLNLSHTLPFLCFVSF